MPYNEYDNNKNNNNDEQHIHQYENGLNYTDISIKSSLKPSASLQSSKSLRPCPIAVFERLCVAENFDYERISETELHLSINGTWCEHDISLVWNAKKEQVDLYLLFEGRTPSGRTDDMCRLVILINERLQTGHFDYWASKNSLVYRDRINLAGGAKLNIEQAMSLLSGALEAAERGYPACQYVVWAGKSPEEALDTALLDLANYV